MKLIENHFTKTHFFVFLGIWLIFSAWPYWIVKHGSVQFSFDIRVALVTLGTIFGPMAGAICRNCQSCCLAFSLSLLPYCGAILTLGTIPLFLKLPFQRGAFVLRMALWIIGLVGWFLGAIVSFGHALE
jgi:hypothetical protein